jgi:Asp-tRNA(Asn)/Glu-tRNA(Gln) amidotransferase A subunit family amidase
VRAQRFRRVYRDRVNALFTDWDILLAPATPSPADAQIELHIAARRNPPPHSAPFDDLSAEPAAVVALEGPPLADLPAAYDRRISVARSLVFGRINSGPAYEHLLPP